MERGASREILDAWERGVDQPPARRALTMLETLAPPAGGPAPRALTAGRRDAALIQAHIELFGSRLDAIGECPRCGQSVELAVDARALWEHATASEPGGESAPGGSGTFSIAVEGLVISARGVTAEDLAVAEGSADPAGAVAMMLNRCVLAAQRDGVPVTARELPDAAVSAVAAALEAADPGADLRLAMSCPACQHAWEEPLDVGAFLWHQVEARAFSLLRDVDTLARAYGWTEPEVLHLSPRRRALYAELAEA